jgi:CheY-like chemotaxis protein
MAEVRGRRGSDVTLRSLRVLIVEDRTDLAQLLVESVTASGHQAAFAHDAASALAMTRDFQPTVILLDIGLPGMDGYTVAERIRSLPGMSNVRIVAVTGLEERTAKRRSRVAGFDRHLVKPVNLDDLQRILEAWSQE